MMDYKTFWKDSVYQSSASPQWAEKVKNYLAEGPTLDMGCGSGRFTHIFSPKNYLGIDISSKNIDNCREKFPDYKFEVRDVIVEELGKYDNIFTWTMLQHIPTRYIKRVAEKMNKSMNLVMCESWTKQDVIWSDYCFNHNYGKLFDIVDKINLEGDVWLMRAKDRS
jgi:SAM-dependent methyltransferase